jgi:hypothetical protein
MIDGQVEFYDTNFPSAKAVRNKDFAFGDQEHFESDNKKRKFSAKAVGATSCYTLSYDKAEQYFPKMIEKEQSTLREDAAQRHDGILKELQNLKNDKFNPGAEARTNLNQLEESNLSEDSRSVHNNDEPLAANLASPTRNRGGNSIESNKSLNRLGNEEHKRPKQRQEQRGR